MKQIMGGFFLALMLYAVPALAEIGFAEVKQSDVNLRETPGGARVCYLDAGYDVYVFEEKLDGCGGYCGGQQLFCRSEKRRKRRDGRHIQGIRPLTGDLFFPFSCDTMIGEIFSRKEWNI